MKGTLHKEAVFSQSKTLSTRRKVHLSAGCFSFGRVLLLVRERQIGIHIPSFQAVLYRVINCREALKKVRFFNGLRELSYLIVSLGVVPGHTASQVLMREKTREDGPCGKVKLRYRSCCDVCLFHPGQSPKNEKRPLEICNQL